MNMGQQIWIESTEFQPVPGEDEETNPGVFGKAFATWLAQRMRETGEPVVEVIAEDWGWCVIVQYRPYLLFIACRCGVGDHPFNPKIEEWAASAVAEPGLLQRLFRRVDPHPDLQRITTWLLENLPSAPGAKRVWVDGNAI
jgi:hypothetical protein